MKKLAFITLILMSMGFTHSSSDEHALVWKTWNEGYPESRASNKIALIDTYTAWCGWCKKMDKDTYEKSEIIERINKDFIPIKFNPELAGSYNVGDTSISGRALLSALSRGKSSGYPTTFFFLPSSNVMYQYPGYMNAEQFAQLLDEMVRVHKATSNPAPKTDSGQAN
ncbi:MAG: DUF255 domain-containing protein [Bacteroidetes bacterium]|nr:DUF255 domain-containing protein [Bacteroidota bacterium]